MFFYVSHINSNCYSNYTAKGTDTTLIWVITVITNLFIFKWICVSFCLIMHWPIEKMLIKKKNLVVIPSDKEPTNV